MKTNLQKKQLLSILEVLYGAYFLTNEFSMLKEQTDNSDSIFSMLLPFSRLGC